MSEPIAQVRVAEGSGPEPRRVGPLTRTDFVQWVGAVADYASPIHYDDAAAREAGYDAVISPGMLQAGMVSDYATDWLGAEHLRRFKVRFAGVVYPGDVLVLSARAARRYADGDEPRVDVELECRRDGEEGPVLTGEATFVLAG